MTDDGRYLRFVAAGDIASECEKNKAGEMCGRLQADDTYVFRGDSCLQQLVQQLTHDSGLGSIADAAA